jgi:hypothetical protein
VSGYALNDGSDGERRFAVRYRDGRYHQRGLGFFGFKRHGCRYARRPRAP